MPKFQQMAFLAHNPRIFSQKNYAPWGFSETPNSTSKLPSRKATTRVTMFPTPKLTPLKTVAQTLRQPLSAHPICAASAVCTPLPPHWQQSSTHPACSKKTKSAGASFFRLVSMNGATLAKCLVTPQSKKTKLT